MLVSEDQERLIAEALRAQVAHTPLAANSDAASGLPGDYGLLSGSDLPRAGATRPAPTAWVAPAEATRRIPPQRPVSVLAILLLAAALGLAAGAVVGLLTLL